jgi:DNA-binding CsgD family transcriptional regulator
VATQAQRARCREQLKRLAGSGLDTESLQRAAISELRPVIGFDRWCWPLADPETLLPGAGLAEHDYGPQLARTLELEYSGEDFAAKDVLARSARGSASLRQETGGDLMRSPRWEQVLGPVGIGDVATVACQDGFGCWGWVEVYRDRSDQPFDRLDLELLSQVGLDLGRALRQRSPIRSVPLREATTADTANGVEPVGVLLLDAELRPVGRTDAVAAWLAELPAAALFEAWGMLPAAIYPAAALARRGLAARAHALLPTETGAWIRIEAASLDDDAHGVVVTLRAPAVEETFDLVARAYALSRREREVAGLLAAGFDTTSVSHRMHISAHTVHDHVKSLLRKVGVRSRAELVARLHGSGVGATP